MSRFLFFVIFNLHGGVLAIRREPDVQIIRVIKVAIEIIQIFQRGAFLKALLWVF